jgi:CHAT domain-containing protein
MFLVSYLSCGRDFVRLHKKPEHWGGYDSAVILADPSYYLTGESPAQGEVPPEREVTPPKTRDVDKLEKSPRLLSTRVEADALDRVFAGNKLKLYELDAKKTAMFHVGAADIVHIATHGFYLNKQSLEDKPFAIEREEVFNSAEDPLIRCGLMFAGVNDWLDPEKQDPPDDYGDGILTAKEVLTLDFKSTNLLVLSACETGLGDANSGEGIQGLRRAFELAGVRTLLCTLWKIDDTPSAILMGEFYSNLFIKGLGMHQALLMAKKCVREITQLELVRYLEANCRELFNAIEKDIAARYGLSLDEYFKAFPDAQDETPYKAPYYWAGFIMQGGISEQ